MGKTVAITGASSGIRHAAGTAAPAYDSVLAPFIPPGSR
jgi:NAD(P)-dependent dehydrogenase (short-subunit alcohol dehydrogenase family)